MIDLNAKSSVKKGTTMVMVNINNDGALFAHCGDSRIYLGLEIIFFEKKF